jgi:5'-deoxynucleotidase YfbR-like HD superfamily hydrolase
MQVNEVYRDYQTPKNLQEHMLRVAALASIILENWKGSNIDKDNIIKACIIHDIAKPMNFDLAKQAQFGMSEEDIEKLRQLQITIKTNFGDDEHRATIGIAKTIGCNANIIKYLDNLEWKYIPKLLEINDNNSLLPIYCDMRIGTKGILTLAERLEDLKNRTNSDEYEANVMNGNELEQLLFKNVNKDLNTITDENINQLFAKLININL